MQENIGQDRHYAGEFSVANNSFPGEIVYNKENGIILLALSKEVEGPGKSFDRLPYIVGKLNTGTIVTLCNCRCVMNKTHNFSVQYLRFRAEYMVWGKSEVADRTFNKFVCTIENGLEWSRLTQIHTDDITTIAFRGLESIPCYQWFGATVKFNTRFDTNIWNLPRSEDCKIIERLQVEIESENKQGIDFFLQVRNKILALISFAIKGNVNVDEQHLCDNDDYYFLNENITRCYEYSITTNERYHYIGKSYAHNRNFFLTELPQRDDLAEIFSKLVPVFNLYLSLFKYDDMPPEMVFLNIVQAIETFHSRFFYNNDKEKYIASVNERFGNLQNFDSIRSLLLSDTQIDKNCTYIILVSRLNDLLIGNYDGLFYEFYGEDNQYAQRIADTRHYYTHYGKSKEPKALKGNELQDAIFILTLLLEYNVCLVLGIDRREQTSQAISAYFSHKQIDEFHTKSIHN